MYLKIGEILTIKQPLTMSFASASYMLTNSQ